MTPMIGYNRLNIDGRPLIEFKEPKPTAILYPNINYQPINKQ